MKFLDRSDLVKWKTRVRTGEKGETLVSYFSKGVIINLGQNGRKLIILKGRPINFPAFAEGDQG